MTRLAEDAALRAALVERGLARVASRSWRHCAERYTDLYRQLA
jgi:glycosyltransferase involved in cell wall biosynthesis